MAFGLPDVVSQGLGFAPPMGQLQPPPPIDDNLGGLDPSVLQGLGLTQPPPQLPPPVESAPPVSTGVPLQLPSAPPAPAQATQAPDFQVPVKAIDGPGAPPPPPVPPPMSTRPLTADQQVTAAGASQDHAAASLQQANTAATQVKVQEADQQLEVYKAADVERAKIQEELKADQDATLKTRAEKTGVLQAFRQQQDSYKTDHNKYWNDLGVGDKVGWFVGMALSGLGNAFLGINNPAQGAAQNPVIGMLLQKTHESIVTQENEREQLDKRAARAEGDLDKFDAFSKDKQARILARGAEAERAVASQIRMVAAKMAPSQILADGLQTAAKLEESAAEKDVKAADQATNVEMDKKRLAIEQAKLRLQQQEAARAAAATKVTDQVYTPEQLKVMNPGVPVPPVGMTQKKYGEWLQTQKHGQDFLTAERTNDPATLARAQQVPGVATKSGKPISFLPDEVKDIKRAKFIATELVRKSDELVGLVEKHGFDSGWTKSKYYQQAQQLHADIVLMSKEQDKLGALSGGDLDIEHKKVGTADPTALRSSVDGIKAFRRSTVQGIGALVGTHAVIPPGEELQPWDPPDPSTLGPPKETQDDVIKKVVLGKQSKDPGATYNPDLKRWEPNIAGLDNPNTRREKIDSPEELAPILARKNDEVGKKFPGVGGATRAVLESTWLRVNSADPAVAQDAKALLEQAAKDSPDDDVSDFAKFLLAKKTDYRVNPETPGQSIAPPGSQLSPEILQQFGINAPR